MPSEQRSLEPREFEILDRAERRFKALNPQGNIDFVLPGEGVNQYLDALTSHGDYWYDKRLAEFVLLQLFSEEEELGIVGREEVGLEIQEDREGDNGEGVTSVDSDRGVMSW
jgi:phospholipase DDHD1